MENKVIVLFGKYLERKCSPAELEEIMKLIELGQHQQEWSEALSIDAERVMNMTNLPILDQAQTNATHERIIYSINEGRGSFAQVKRKLYPTYVSLRNGHWMVSAAALVVVLFGVSLLVSQHLSSNNESQIIYQNDIAPGKRGATLTLANGKKINLSDQPNMELIEEAGVSVRKTADGRLIYELNSFAKPNGKTNNLSTSRGETFQLILPDGSSVWLNAASSLSYPVNFNTLKNRSVTLRGEAYFEIQKDPAHPFIVHTEQQSTMVLGTHFNVSSYDRETPATTLLEGTVKVTNSLGNESVILLPGQQSLTYKKNIRVVRVKTEQVVDWKNGEFIFEDESLSSILLKVSRWYDVNVIYEDPNVQSESFSGSVSRFENVSELLSSLQLTGRVHFQIEGKTIYVMK